MQLDKSHPLLDYLPRSIHIWKEFIRHGFAIPKTDAEIDNFNQRIQLITQYGKFKDIDVATIDMACYAWRMVAGQRMTSSSLIGCDGWPPTYEALLQSATVPYNEFLSVAAKAYSKHAYRNPAYWGKVHGSLKDQNEVAKRRLNDIIEQWTWWNIFGHHKHEVLFELRIGSGEGARWRILHEVIEFIGFTEAEDKQTGLLFS